MQRRSDGLGSRPAPRHPRPTSSSLTASHCAVGIYALTVDTRSDVYSVSTRERMYGALSRDDLAGRRLPVGLNRGAVRWLAAVGRAGWAPQRDRPLALTTADALIGGVASDPVHDAGPHWSHRRG